MLLRTAIPSALSCYWRMGQSLVRQSWMRCSYSSGPPCVRHMSRKECTVQCFVTCASWCQPPVLTACNWEAVAVPCLGLHLAPPIFSLAENVGLFCLGFTMFPVPASLSD